MFANMVSMINNILQPVVPQQVQTVAQPVISENPFVTSPFITAPTQKSSFYGKNNPVAGGYFAGYHNGKPNIVGKRLFIEV